jgi:hypothetical protein
LALAAVEAARSLSGNDGRSPHLCHPGIAEIGMAA